MFQVVPSYAITYVRKSEAAAAVNGFGALAVMLKLVNRGWHESLLLGSEPSVRVSLNGSGPESEIFFISEF